jgi:hypothetical protein
MRQAVERMVHDAWKSAISGLGGDDVSPRPTEPEPLEWRDPAIGADDIVVRDLDLREASGLGARIDGKGGKSISMGGIANGRPRRGLGDIDRGALACRRV